MDRFSVKTHPDLLQHLSLDLPQTLGALRPGDILGNWPQGMVEATPAPSFVPSLYEADHHHPHAEICLALSGKCRLSLGQARVFLYPGQMVLIPPHEIHAETYASPSSSYSLAWWILSADEPTFQITNYSQKEGFSVQHRTALTSSFSALKALHVATMGNCPPEFLPFKEALLNTLLELMRRYREPGTVLDQRPQVVEQAYRYIREHLHEPLELAAVSREVLLSPNYLTSLFKQHTGASLGQTIKKLRIERACSLLRNSSKQIQEISALVGFQDPFAFSKAFRKHTGVAPSQYRERVQTCKMDSHS